MFLSSEQQYLLAQLRQFHCLRKAQAAQLLYRAFGTKPQNVPHIIRQLHVRGQICHKDEIVTEVGAHVRPETLYAVDVLLALFDGIFPEITMQQGSPFLLSAYSPTEDLQLQILHIPIGSEEKKCVLIDALPEPGIPTTLILLLEHETQRASIFTLRPCVLAFRNEFGKLLMIQHEGGKKHDERKQES